MKTLKYITPKDFTYIAIIVIIIIIFMQGCFNKDPNLNFQSYDDTIKVYKNKYNEEVAITQSLTFTNFKQLEGLKIRDKSISELVTTVNRYKKDLKNATGLVVIKTQTKIDTVFKTKIITIDSTGHPVYGFEDSNIWYSIKGKVGYNTTKIELGVNNEYIVILTKKRVSLFSYQPVVELINKNPFSNVADLKSIQIQNKMKSKGGIGISIGYGISYDFKPRPYIGISYNYNILNL